MTIPTGHRLEYVLLHEEPAWLKMTPGLRGNPQIVVRLVHHEGGIAWEFAAVQHYAGHPAELHAAGMAGPQPYTSIEVCDDAYAAFAEIPDFFQEMAKRLPSSLAAVVEILQQLGATDETRRI